MRLCLARVVTPRLMRAMSYILVKIERRGPAGSTQAVGRPFLDGLGIGVRNYAGAAILADILGIVADQPVALASDAVLHLAGGGELEALLDAALGLQLGHFGLLFGNPHQANMAAHNQPARLFGSVRA